MDMITGQSVEVLQPVVNPYASISCQCCGNGDVQRVTGVIQSGNWTSKNVGLSMERGHLGDTPLTMYGGNVGMSFGSSNLAAALAPPSQPNGFWSGVCKLWAMWLGVWGVLTCGAGIACALQIPDDTGKISDPILSIPAVFCGLLFMFFTVRSWKAGSREKALVPEREQAWVRQMERWNNLVYCSKCDNISIPGTGHYCHPSNMMDILSC